MQDLHRRQLARMSLANMNSERVPLSNSKKWLLLWGFLRIGIWMNILCGSMAIRMLTSGKWLKRIEKKDFGDLLRNAA